MTVPETRFSSCMPIVLAQECPDPSNWSDPRNFSNLPHDPGGATMCGITQAEYAAHGWPGSVEFISIHQGWTIYLNSYWLPHSPELPTGLDLSFFDICVNAGPGGAIRTFQSSLGVGVDGIFGPITAGAVARISNATTAIEAYCGARARYYRALANFRYFGQAWIQRALRIQNYSLAMLPGLLTESPIVVTGPFQKTAKAYS